MNIIYLYYLPSHIERYDYSAKIHLEVLHLLVLTKINQTNVMY